MLRKYILDDKGDPVVCTNLLTWALWFETAEHQVALTTVGAADVSTVFLGLDHRHGRRGPPILFETMVFGGPLDQLTERYATRAAALAGHDQFVARLRDLEAEAGGGPARL